MRRRWRKRAMTALDWHTTPRARRLAVIAEASAAGLSASQIAATRFTGTTRSAILGAAHRAGLALGPERKTATRRATATVKTPARAPKPAPRRFDRAATRPAVEAAPPIETPPAEPAAPAAPAEQAAPAAPVTLLAAGPHQCRWPLWGRDEHEPSRHFICGVPCEGPYCDDHTARSIAPKKTGDGE